jgi:hypothetical protein
MLFCSVVTAHMHVWSNNLSPLVSARLARARKNSEDLSNSPSYFYRGLVEHMASLVACGVSRGCSFGDASLRKGSGALQEAAAIANGAPSSEKSVAYSLIL